MPIWQPTDAYQLRQLRLARGQDTMALALRCAISERQVLELEGIGEGSFYSEAIKYQTGLKLLRHLGQGSPAISLHPSGSGQSRSHKPAVILPLSVAPPSENHILLHRIGLAFVISGLLVSIVNVVDGLGLRPGGVLLALIGLCIVFLAYRGKSKSAVLWLCWGCLAINFSSALVVRGLAHVSWVAVPIAIMAAGWFLGRAMAWVIAGVSGLGALAVYALHWYQYPFATEVPLETLLAALWVSFAVAALIGGAISQTYGRQFELINESRAELHAVMDSTRAMIWSVDARDLRLRTFNRVTEQEIHAKLGSTITLGMPPTDMFGSEALGHGWSEFYRKALESNGLAFEEDIFGDSRQFEVSFQPIRRDNRVIGLAIYAQDITDRKRKS